MSTAQNIRVAVAQFHVGADIKSNLAKSLHWLDQASSCGPQLVVLPEFCNHLSWYEDKQHCFDVSVTLDGPFLTAIADKAGGLGIHVVVNVRYNARMVRLPAPVCYTAPRGSCWRIIPSRFISAMKMTFWKS